jgi:hypothetical protein
METFKFVPGEYDTFAQSMALKANVLLPKEDRMSREQYQKQGGIQIELLVNGHPLSFNKFMDEVYESMQHSLNERARVIAMNIICDNGLDKLWEVWDTATNMCENKLHDVLPES